MTDPRAMLGLFSAAAVCPIIVFGAYCLVRIVAGRAKFACARRLPLCRVLPLLALAASLTSLMAKRGQVDSAGRARCPQRAAMPGDAAEHECSITDFTLDHSDRTARFVISWTDGLFDHTLTRNLYLYASTNLAERRWSMLGAFPVPLSATSPHALTVTQANVFEAMRPRFLDTFGGAGFYRFEIDLDSDGDGLSDARERELGTDPNLEDTDGDGIADGVEVNIHGTNPVLADTDGDGLTDFEELLHGTSQTNRDSDGDGLLDGWEVANFLNPRSAEGNNGASADIDRDGLTNLEEQSAGSNPMNPDTDGDWLSDSQEVALGTNPALADTDGDGIDDRVEVSIGSDPCAADSDGDGLPDGWERDNGLNPLSAEGVDGANGDTDGDGLPNLGEYENGANPRVVDTDGDGVTDKAEVGQGGDPADASDMGLPPAAEEVREIAFAIGGDWAAWEMTVEGIGPDDFRTRRISMSGPDQVASRTCKLHRGNTYRLSMRWLNCAGHESHPAAPWYCWSAKIDGLPSVATYPDYGAVRIPGVAETVVGDGWIAKNDEGLLTSHVHENSSGESGNVAEGLAALLHVFAEPVIIAPATLGVNNDDDDGNGKEDVEDASLLDSDDVVAEVHVRFTGPPWMDCTARLETWMDPLMFGHLWKNRAKTGYAMSAPSREEFTFRGELVKTYFMEADFRSPNMRGNKMVATTQFGEVSLSATHVPIFVERVAEPVTTERVNGHIVNPCCAVIGADAHMRVKVLPEDYPDSRIKWRVVEGAGSFPEGDTGRDVVFRASGAEGETVKLQVDVGDCPGNAPQFTMQTTAMHEVKIYPCAISRLGREPPADAAKIAAMIDEVNVVFRQLGVFFSLGAQVENIVNENWSVNAMVNRLVRRQIRNEMSGKDGVEVYFVDGNAVSGEPSGLYDPTGIIIKGSALSTTLAHELGHAFGCADILMNEEGQKVKGTAPIPFFFDSPKRSWIPEDWNNGTGGRFYPKDIFYAELMERFLMFGVETSKGVDIPLGTAYGLPAEGNAKEIDVGRSAIMSMSPRSL